MNAAKPAPGRRSRADRSPEEQAAWDKYFEYLIKSLREPDANARGQAAKILGENREARAVVPLGAALYDPDASVRQQAAEALGRIGAAAIEPLIRALQDPDAEVRYLATKALGQIDSDRTLPPLVACLRDTDAGVRSQAAFALHRLSGRAVEALVAALSHADPSLRLQAARILGQIGDARALPELERLGRDDKGSGKGPGSITSVAEAARQAALKIKSRT